MPVYNAEQFLHTSVASVTNQTYQNIELILVNDGSTDDSEAICNQYASADKRIKVISQKNSGPAAARNTGVRHASGEFVFFLDADDLIDNQAIEKMVQCYEIYQPDLVMSNFCKQESTGNVIDQIVTFHPDENPFTGDIQFLSRENILSFIRHFLKYPSNHLISYCWARLYKLSLIKENKITANENMRLFEDYVFNLEYLKHTDKIVFINEPLYTYVMYSNHVTASMAIVMGDSLLHDVNIFRIKTKEIFQHADIVAMPRIEQEIGHALLHYVIIFFIRSCRQLTSCNRNIIGNEINTIIHAPILRDLLRHYRPNKGNSRVIPLLMKLKFLHLLMFACQRKAYKRYGKPDPVTQ